MSSVRIEREFTATSDRFNKSPSQLGQKASQLIGSLTLDVADVEEQETIEALKNEELSGTCKSGYALQYKMNTDQDRAKMQLIKEQPRHRSKTRGRFPIDYVTSAGSFMQDRQWKYTANPTFKQNEERLEAIDFKQLKKRKHTKMLQNKVVEEQYKIHVKKRF